MKARNTSQRCPFGTRAYTYPMCTVVRCDGTEHIFSSPVSARVNTTASLVILGWGIEPYFSVDAAFSILQEVAEDIRLNFRQKPALVWHAADFRHTQRFAWQTTPRVVAYNAAMRERLQQPLLPGLLDGPMPMMEFYNVTEGLLAKDGTHFGQGPNLLKVQLLLQLLDS